MGMFNFVNDSVFAKAVGDSFTYNYKDFLGQCILAIDYGEYTDACQLALFAANGSSYRVNCNPRHDVNWRKNAVDDINRQIEADMKKDINWLENNVRKVVGGE